MIKHGLQNCVVPNERLLSDVIMDDVLSGKRAVLRSLAKCKSLLSIRVKKKERCGFDISELAAIYEPHYMLFNKKFNKKLKEKIDFKYVRITS